MSSPNDKPETQMTKAPVSQTKLVKIKANYPLRIMNGPDETIIQPGSTAEVSEKDAEEFCDKKFNIGYKDTFGERDKRDIKKSVIARADRVV